MESVRNIDELRRYAHSVFAMPHATFQDVRYLKLPADVANVGVLILKRKSGRPGHHEQAANLRERIDDLLGDPIAEIFLILGRTYVDKRQNDDALLQTLY